MINEKPITNEEIARLRELASEATPGPLRVEHLDVGYVSARFEVVGPERRTNHGTVTPVVCTATFYPDAALIAAAREALPRLLDALEDGSGRSFGHPECYWRQRAEAAERERDGVRVRHTIYLNAIGAAIGDERAKRDTGEPAASDAAEIMRLRGERDEARAGAAALREALEGVHEDHWCPACSSEPGVECAALATAAGRDELERRQRAETLVEKLTARIADLEADPPGTVAEVARLRAGVETGVVPGRSEHMPTQRCRTCGALWKLHDNGVWAPRSIATACCSGAVPPIDVELEEYEGTPGGGT